MAPRAAILLSMLLFAGQALLALHQADHYANPSYQACDICLSVNLDDANPVPSVAMTFVDRRHDRPDFTIPDTVSTPSRESTRIRSPPRLA